MISNAQDLSEEWRPLADQEFGVRIAYLPVAQQYMFHAAGQPFTGELRTILERDIRRCLDRHCRAEAVARLLARAIRAVAEVNSRVGRNVMCTMVRRDLVGDTSGTYTGGMAPLVPEVRAEATYFRWPRDSSPSQWIFLPDTPGAWPYYGPNIAEGDMQIKGLRLGPDTEFSVDQASAGGAKSASPR